MEVPANNQDSAEQETFVRHSVHEPPSMSGPESSQPTDSTGEKTSELRKLLDKAAVLVETSEPSSHPESLAF